MNKGEPFVEDQQPQSTQTPTVQQPQVQSSPPIPASPTPMPEAPAGQSGSKKTKKFLVPIVAAFILLAGGAAAAFNAYVVNSPENIWARAMDNTADGLDAFLESAVEQQAPGGKVNGSFKIEKPVAADGVVEGAWHESTMQLSGNVSYAGFRLQTELRAVDVENSDMPDAYFKVEGLESLSSMLGGFDPAIAGIIDEVNGSWYVVDHTLFEQAENEAEGENLQFTKEEIAEIANKTAGVLREYVFTTDNSKAAAQVDEEVGREDFDGRDTYKFIVRVNKDNLKTFLSAYKDAMKGTQLEQLLFRASPDATTIEEALSFDELMSEIDKADFSNATAEAWVDMDTKLIRNIRITPTNQDAGTTGYIDLGLAYDGGDTLPFTINIYTGKEEATGNELTMQTRVEFNQETGAATFSVQADGTMDGEELKANGTLSLTPSDEAITVEVPAGAKNIYELIGLFLGGLGQFPAGPESQDAFNQMDFDSLPLDDVQL